MLGFHPQSPERAVPAAILLSIAKILSYLPKERPTPIPFSSKIFEDGVRGKPLFLKRGFPGYFPSSSFEVVKMSKGKWTRHTHLFEKDEYECSVCHETFDKPSAVCPKCGTKMKSSVKYDASWVDEMADYDSMFGDDD